jgi:alkanesulfonate monooxygenase SsuD/methylene tetrahydromethanopterin reductase-like flavin-dependent oxidoreductase (luciferase family)
VSSDSDDVDGTLDCGVGSATADQSFLDRWTAAARSAGRRRRRIDFAVHVSVTGTSSASAWNGDDRRPGAVTVGGTAGGTIVEQRTDGRIAGGIDRDSGSLWWR